MKNFKFIQKEITQKEINIKAETEMEALDLYIDIQEKTDILDNENKLGKSKEFELTIDETDLEDDEDYAGGYDEEYDEDYDDSDELDDDIESIVTGEYGYHIKIEKI